MVDRIFTFEEVKKHNKEGDIWIIIGDKVYDVSKFIAIHPAGKNVILQQAGQDATEMQSQKNKTKKFTFHSFGQFHDRHLIKNYSKLIIGKVEKQQPDIAPILQFKDTFGDGIPFGDPNYLQGWKSPFYNESHKQLRAALRKFTEGEVREQYQEWKAKGEIPRSFKLRNGELGMYALIMGTPWPEEWYPKKVCCGVELQNPDIFHTLIAWDEIYRVGGHEIFYGQYIGLPPIMHFGSDYLKEKIVGPCLRGEKDIVLAITEPFGGSDVANIKATAILSPDKKYYIVNGLKKWITNAIFSDYITTAVRTGGDGMGGISMLVIDSKAQGVNLKYMKTQGSDANAGGKSLTGTTFIIFTDVKVPVENLVGQEGLGFKYVMFNFNYERLVISMHGNRVARICLEECMIYAHKRKTFGKKLIDHPVIRSKLANMARLIESNYAYLETVCYNYQKMNFKQKMTQLPGSIALLKAHTSQMIDYCANEGIQIFGGLGYTQSGQGARVEKIYRAIKAYAIPGGSEEIMLDLGAKMASKLMPKI